MSLRLPATLAALALTTACGRINYDPVGGANQQDAGFDGETPDNALFADQISVGRLHSCALQDGLLWCWGNNSGGMLGVDDTAPRDKPTQVGASILWAKVSAGGTHTCAIDDQDRLHCWGDNGSGQLGLGDTNKRFVPTLVSAGWQDVQTGYLHTMAVRGGELWTWGDNSEGQLGLGNVTPSESAPTRVGFSDDWLQGNSTPNNFGCATNQMDQVWCWGSNEEGQLGSGLRDNVPTPTPTLVPGTTWQQVASGEEHACGLDLAGQIWSWGDNREGQLGTGDTVDVLSPTMIGSDYKTVAAGGHATCGIKTSGQLWCWGDNRSGQLGPQEVPSYTLPTQVGTRSDWAAISIGLRHICALREDSSVWCAGSNLDGRLGQGDSLMHNGLQPVLDAR